MKYEQVWFLRHFGYLNEAAPDVSGLDFEKLEMQDDPIVEAVKLLQGYFHQFLDDLCLRIHGRLCIVDGEPGPATSYLFHMPRCYAPDFEPDAAADSYRLWSREEANIPTQCRGELRIGRDFAALPGLTKEETDGIYWAMAHNWTETFEDIRITPNNDAVGNPNGTIFYHRKEAMRGSTLAYHYLARNRCERLDGAWNSSVKWDRRLGAPVGTHEICHGLGANHNNDPNATMYPAITNAAKGRYGFPNKTDMSAMKQLGYRPYDNWEKRQLPESRLFLPRDAAPLPPPPPGDVAERVKGLEQRAFENIVTDAAQDAQLAWLKSRLDALEGKK